MSPTSKTDTDLGSEVLKQIGSLNSATSELEHDSETECGINAEETVGVLAIIARAILKVFQ